MKRKNNIGQNEDGFVLIASLLILLVLTVLGIAVNQNTDTELRIAMNDRLHKETFYAADAATELASEVLQQSVACFGFGEDTSTDTDKMTRGKRLSGSSASYDVFIHAPALGFWRNYAVGGVIADPYDGMDENGDGYGDGWDCDTDTISDGFGNNVGLNFLKNNTCPSARRVPARQIVFPAVVVTSDEKIINMTATNKQPHANINIGGNTRLKEGSAIQMAAGYEGLGKGGSGSGVVLLYDIKVQQVGREGSTSNVCVQYGLSPDRVGDCTYIDK